MRARIRRPFTPRATSDLTTKLLTLLLLAWASTIVLHAQEALKTGAAPAPTSYGTISGRLMSDDGRPLSNSTVSILPYGSSVPSPPRTGTTDASGRFEFKNLPSGTYIIQMSVPGYVRLRDVGEEDERAERSYYRVGESANITMTKGGVITGTVTDSAGRALVAMRVRAVRVRDASGKALRASSLTREVQTDDRGVYRIWGLEPGSYLVSAGNNSQYFDFQSPATGEAPTYYPSASRDGATEVSVRYGDEQSGIDIRYRNERGRKVSGTLSGAIEASGIYGDINVSLVHAASGLVDDRSYVRPGEASSFTFNNVADGEYDLVARRGFGSDSAASAPLRIKVRGADISGLELVLAPLGTITGRLVMEAAAAAPASSCEEKPKGQDARQSALEEAVIVARLEDRSQERLRSMLPRALDSQPRSDGEFLFGGLQPGRYRLDARLPDERWYVRAITLADAATPLKTKAATGARPSRSDAPHAASSGAPRAASAGGALTPDGAVLIGQGTRATAIRITLASGAAKLSGRVVPSVEGASLPPRLRLYLVPRDAERANDVLRFGEAEIRRDTTFTLPNLAPGRYWLLARTAPDQEENDTARPLPVAWNAEARAELRRQAEAAHQEIELQPCQQMTDISVRYGPAAPVNK